MKPGLKTVSLAGYLLCGILCPRCLHLGGGGGAAVRAIWCGCPDRTKFISHRDAWLCKIPVKSPDSRGGVHVPLENGDSVFKERKKGCFLNKLTTGFRD